MGGLHIGRKFKKMHIGRKLKKVKKIGTKAGHEIEHGLHKTIKYGDDVLRTADLLNIPVLGQIDDAVHLAKDIDDGIQKIKRTTHHAKKLSSDVKHLGNDFKHLSSEQLRSRIDNLRQGAENVKSSGQTLRNHRVGRH